MEDDGTAATARLWPRHGEATRALVGTDGDRGGGIHVHRLRVVGLELGQGSRQITGVDLLVGRIFIAHLPSVRGAWGRRDEEELVQLRRFQQLLAPGVLLAQDGGGFTEIDPRTHIAVQQTSVLERLPDSNGILVRVEGADDAAE